MVIGLGASSLLWYWLFSYDFGLVNRALIDLGIVGKPVLWFGADADIAMWAVIASIVWKVVGFGMILFVAAIQAIPSRDQRGDDGRRRQPTGSGCGASPCR